MALTPSFVLDLETRMHVITEGEYDRLNRALWWQQITKVRQSTGAKELMMWLLSTAMIRDRDKGGNIHFDDIVSQYQTIEIRDAGAGLKIRRQEFEDVANGIVGGMGIDLAAHWSRDIGAYMAYWPQKQIVRFMKQGHTTSLLTGYDGKALFATDHPINPYQTSMGNYGNLLTGAQSGAYPGALPIDESVTIEVALANLAKLFGYIASIKMPNGEDPRHLRPKTLLVPPRLFPRAVMLTNAKFIASAATGGAAVADVERLIGSLGFAQPVMVDELAGFENDTTYFVAAEQITSSDLGGFIYLEREPFYINYYGEQTDAELSRRDELEWHCKGRNAVGIGHPYLLFKVKGS
jgi:phage major head subunit gpT-like protein